jgi:psiF repeat-containing protein
MTIMLRTLGLFALTLVLLASPASAITTNEKMETCKVGAEAQNLDGAKAKAFINKCMAKGNYEPAARRAAKKTGAKKPAAKPAAIPSSNEPGQK